MVVTALSDMMLPAERLLTKVGLIVCTKGGGIAIGAKDVIKFYILHLLGKDWMNLYPLAELAYLAA